MKPPTKTTVAALVGGESGLKAVSGDESYLNRIGGQTLDFDELLSLRRIASRVGVTQRFREVVDYFRTPEGETPAGFRVDGVLDGDDVLRYDLARDIAYDKNSQKRPTGLVFSVDTANPHEVEPCARLIGNLTCNPGIVYDLFLNDPKANVGNKFKTLEEVLEELARIVGPGT